jgi:hypothetical protein
MQRSRCRLSRSGVRRSCGIAISMALHAVFVVSVASTVGASRPERMQASARVELDVRVPAPIQVVVLDAEHEEKKAAPSPSPLVPRRSGSDRFTRQPSGGSLVAGTHVQASHGRAQR